MIQPTKTNNPITPITLNTEINTIVRTLSVEKKLYQLENSQTCDYGLD
jgi:hypothetical protein